MATRVPFIKEPMLLVFKEKHGDRYYHVVDDKMLLAVALKILTERFEEGYWYGEPSDLPDPPKAPDFTKEQVEAMPESLRPAAYKKLHDYAVAMRQYNEEVDDYRRIEKAVREKDGREAWQALNDRSDAEYEGFNLERYESVDEDEEGA